MEMITDNSSFELGFLQQSNKRRVAELKELAESEGISGELSCKLYAIALKMEGDISSAQTAAIANMIEFNGKVIAEIKAGQNV